MAIDVEQRRPKLSNVRRRPERPGDPPDRRPDGLRVPAGSEDPDHRHGRHHGRPRRARVHDRRRQRRAGRHRQLRRSVHLAEAARRPDRLHDAARHHAARRTWSARSTRRRRPRRTHEPDSRRPRRPTAARALALADQLRGAVGGFKIGKQLFTAEGPAIVRTLAERGDTVFLDLKFHDIPNTVAGAVASAVATGRVDGQRALLRRRRDDAGRGRRGRRRPPRRSGVPRPLVIGVTVLTSMDEAALAEVGVHAAGDGPGAAPGRGSRRPRASTASSRRRSRPRPSARPAARTSPSSRPASAPPPRPAATTRRAR